MNMTCDLEAGSHSPPRYQSPPLMIPRSKCVSIVLCKKSDLAAAPKDAVRTLPADTGGLHHFIVCIINTINRRPPLNAGSLSPARSSR